MTPTEIVFFELLRAGLWELDFERLPYGQVDYNEVYKLAEEQAVVGIVASGLEHITDCKPDKAELLPFITHVIAMEQRNIAMNEFIDELISKLRHESVQAILIKGQGVSQSYNRPLWRTCGDVDFLLGVNEYEKAKLILTPLALNVDTEYIAEKHLGMTLKDYVVELHGTLKFGLSRRVDKVMENVQEEVCCRGAARVWRNGNSNSFVLLPSPDNDVMIIFTHFLRHFYKGGIGLRQICDWCRLLWTYRDEINRRLLKQRIVETGLESEWKAFAAYAVDYLGMPVEAMLLYEDGAKWHRKANRLQQFILKVGNFGHNRDNSYYSKFPYVIRKAFSAFRRIGDGISHVRIFPLDSIKFTFNNMLIGVRSAVRGE